MPVHPWNSDDVARLAARFEDAKALDVLAWAVDEFHPAIALGTGLGVEGMVIIDLVQNLTRRPRVFLLDTGRLPQETYNLIEWVQSRYDLAIEVYCPDGARLERIVREHGPNMFYRSAQLRRLCCYVRKVEPLRRALAGLDAWITGLRREQSPTRSRIGKVELDSGNGGLIKINPLADWTTGDVWAYVRRNGVPYNVLHDRGYPSIGCAPCTRAVPPGQGLRSGRWWWERPDEKECGLHTFVAEEPEAAR